MKRVPQNIRDIDRDFQQKERQEFTSIPDTRIRRRGERELYTPDADDDYAIINTRHGWKKIAFLQVETSIPSDSVGENGEFRILSTSTKNSIIYKSNDAWYELNYEIIADAVGLDALAIETEGETATRTSMTSVSLSTDGEHL
jgi:hypothetical protein